MFMFERIRILRWRQRSKDFNAKLIFSNLRLYNFTYTWFQRKFSRSCRRTYSIHSLPTVRNFTRRDNRFSFNRGRGVSWINCPTHITLECDIQSKRNDNAEILKETIFVDAASIKHWRRRYNIITVLLRRLLFGPSCMIINFRVRRF